MKHLLVCLIAGVTLLPAQTKPVYEVYAVQYGQIKDFPVAGLVAGADRARRMDIAMYVWLIKGNGRNILFDAGFYREQFLKRWKPAEFVRPSEAVAKAGVKPEDITDVIISHIHWDHADGFDLFPKAKVWIQRDEYVFYTADAWQGPAGQRGVAADADDVMALVKANVERRVALVNGDGQEVAPGITAYTGGKHTYQSQFITVNTAGGTVVLASDNVYLYENLEKHVPIAATLDADSNLRAQDRMRALASKPEWIVPGHDPAVLKHFPAVSPGVVRIQ